MCLKHAKYLNKDAIDRPRKAKVRGRRCTMVEIGSSKANSHPPRMIPRQKYAQSTAVALGKIHMFGV